MNFLTSKTISVFIREYLLLEIQVLGGEWKEFERVIDTYQL